MNKRIWIFVLLPILVSSLACQAVFGVFNPTPTPTPTLTSTFTPLPPTNTPSPSPTVVPPTATPIPPTLTPTLTYTPTHPPVTASPNQLAVFEKLWQVINNEYLYPDFNGADWDALHDEYRQKVEAGLTPGEFYDTMNLLILQLGDEHSFFLSPEQVAEQEAEFNGNNDYVGVGVYTVAVPERKRVTIILTFPGGPAELAGLKSHDSILEVDGQPIIDENGIRVQLLRGPEGSQVTLTVESPGQEPRQVTLTRKRIQGALPVPYSLLTTPSGKRIGYILVSSFADDTVGAEVGQALVALSKDAPLDGVILDNRQNSGGADVVAQDTLSYFTSGNVGYFANRKGEKRWFRVNGKNVAGSASVPLVVLIGENTVSFGEIFAGVLKDEGRATLIGETTTGNVELLMRFDFVDGSRAWIAHEAFHPANHPNQNWEQTGIVPDVAVTSSWDEYDLDNDPAVLAALQTLDQD